MRGDIIDPTWWREWQEQRAFHLHKIGVDIEAIAERVSKTPEQVMKKLRGERDADLPRKENPFTDEDDARLIKLLERYTYSGIAREMRRTRSSISGRVHRLKKKGLLPCHLMTKASCRMHPTSLANRRTLRQRSGASSFGQTARKRVPGSTASRVESKTRRSGTQIAK